MVKKTFSILSILILLGSFTYQADASEKKEITVSAAISLKNSFEEIGKLFETTNNDVKVLFNFGASGDLLTQIKGGAPVDIFASASLKDMDELDKTGGVLQDTKTNFATNTVVLVIPSTSNNVIASFEDLTKPEIKKIAVGNPKTVPAGRYAEEIFKYYTISDKLSSKLILAENARQVLDYVVRGEVDAGVVYITDALSKQQEVKVVVAALGVSHKPVIYPIAVVKGSKNEETAKIFISFVLSKAGAEILEKNGFKPFVK